MKEAECPLFLGAIKEPSSRLRIIAWQRTINRYAYSILCLQHIVHEMLYAQICNCKAQFQGDQ
jgi:hypothetical protein